MEKEVEYYTLKGYQHKAAGEMTSSMEDYLEMICRMMEISDVVRISELANMLHVKPSSASKMVNNLKNEGLVLFERYGYVKPTTKGEEIGKYLLYRHRVLNQFLCRINGTTDETEQVEKIEHFLNEDTIRNMERIMHQKET